MARTNNEVVAYWADNIVSSGEPTKAVGGTVRVTPDGVIRYVRFRGQRRLPFGPVDLGIYLPGSKSVLLNGDGFADGNATNWQTILRNSCLIRRGRSKHLKHILVVPFAALDAAGIEHQSIRPIDVRNDENIEIYHRVEVVEDPKWWKDKQITRDDSIRIQVATLNRVTLRRELSFAYGYRSPDKKQFSTTRKESNWQYGYSSDEKDAKVRYQVSTPAGWQRLVLHDEASLQHQHILRRTRNEQAARSGGAVFGGEIPSEPGYYWIGLEHHLGAALFSAVDDTGGRHKFISAFDEDEPNRMYYLAQLPDRSGASTYAEALLALAPPIVHKARLEGRAVRRQGDVFAIATNLTDDEVYAMAKTRVRRNIALFNLARSLSQIMAGHLKEPLPGPKEVAEFIDCPCGCGHRRRVGWGPKARKALMIYGTGHTADEVVTTSKGTTYIRGTMFHDPHLQEPGRSAEHANVPLGGDGGWYLAVRNTVPRKRSRQQEAVAQPQEEGVTAS